MTLLQKLDEFPPSVVRMSARNGRGKPMTLREIASRCGLSTAKVNWVAMQTTWAGQDVEVVDEFLKGCGYEFSDLSKLRKYIRRTSKSKNRPFSHLSSKKLTKRQIASIAKSVERVAADLA